MRKSVYNITLELYNRGWKKHGKKICFGWEKEHKSETILSGELNFRYLRYLTIRMNVRWRIESQRGEAVSSKSICKLIEKCGNCCFVYNGAGLLHGWPGPWPLQC